MKEEKLRKQLKKKRGDHSFPEKYKIKLIFNHFYTRAKLKTPKKKKKILKKIGWTRFYSFLSRFITNITFLSVINNLPIVHFSMRSL